MAESNDDFDLSDEDDGLEDTGSGQDSGPIKQLRSQLRAAQKERKASEARLKELEAFKTEFDSKERTAKTESIFKEMGLSPKQVDLFYTKNGTEAEATPEAIAKFALDYDLVVSENREVVEEAATEAKPFVPVSPGGAVPVRGMLNREQYEALKRTDMAAAFKAVAENRVEGLHTRLDESGVIANDWIH